MKTPLKFMLNPCDVERHPSLAPIGDALASLYDRFTAGTDCPCCLGARLAGALIAAATLGALTHAFLS